MSDAASFLPPECREAIEHSVSILLSAQGHPSFDHSPEGVKKFLAHLPSLIGETACKAAPELFEDQLIVWNVCPAALNYTAQLLPQPNLGGTYSEMPVSIADSGNFN